MPKFRVEYDLIVTKKKGIYAVEMEAVDADHAKKLIESMGPCNLPAKQIGEHFGTHEETYGVRKVVPL